MKPFAHQKVTTDFINDNSRCLITSDPGTGKTRSVLDALVGRKHRTLVLAPLSILEASWGDDILKFTPELTYAVAYAKNREKAFASDAKVVITNHDAIKWILKNKKVLLDFDTLVIDEFTAFKNKDSQRSKAMLKMRRTTLVAIVLMIATLFMRTENGVTAIPIRRQTPPLHMVLVAIM